MSGEERSFGDLRTDVKKVFGDRECRLTADIKRGCPGSI